MAGLIPVAVIAVTALLLALESTAAALGHLNHIFVIGPKYELFNGDVGRGGGRVAAAVALFGSVMRGITLGALEARPPAARPPPSLLVPIRTYLHRPAAAL